MLTRGSWGGGGARPDAAAPTRAPLTAAYFVYSCRDGGVKLCGQH